MSQRPKETMEKIEHLITLPDGWHFGEGRKFSDEILKAARDMVLSLALLDFTETDVFPGMEGEIQLTAYEGNATYVVEISPSGKSFTLTKEIGDKDVFENSNLTAKDVLLQLKERNMT